MTRVAVDTSAAIPYVIQGHEAHWAVRRHLYGRQPVLTSHSLAETYSVLTRMHGDARVSPPDADKLISASFGPPALLTGQAAATLPAVLAPLEIAGGAVYDALVALAAKEAGLRLVTRDARATATYLTLSVEIEMIP